MIAAKVNIIPKLTISKVDTTDATDPNQVQNINVKQKKLIPKFSNSERNPKTEKTFYANIKYEEKSKTRQR